MNLNKQEFLAHCETKEREMLLGVTDMDFETFERLVFLAEHFGCEEYEKELWNRFSSRFLDRYNAEKELLTEKRIQQEMEKRNRWIREFLEKTE